MGLLLSRRIIGRVNDHVHKYLRILNGRKSGKGHQIILGASGLLLSRTRLAAHIIANDLGRLSRACLNGLEHGLLQEIRGGLGYGLPHQHRLLFLHHGPLLIENLLHHMGFIVGTPVQNRAERRGQLHHGTVVVLSKGIGSQVRRPDVVRTVNQPAGVRLSGQVNPRLVAKPKDALIFGKTLSSYHGSNAHHGHIAGLHQ